MKIDRLIGILMILINQKKVTAKYLSEHFEVSVRTIQRDIDTLTLAGIPLFADVGVNGGYQLMEDYKLDKSFLNNNEANVLISFLENLSAVVPYEELQSMSNKFSSLSHMTNTTNKLVIQLNPGLDTDLFRSHLNTLTKARDQLRKVAIVYYNIDFNKTTRIICPHTLILYASNWYVYGYCDLRDDFRMFKIHRIVKCSLLKESFQLKTMPSPLPWEKALDSGTKTDEIVLKIDRKLQGKLPDYFGPDDCQLFENYILVTVHFPIDEWVYTLLMSLVPYIEVIKPIALRQEFTNRLKKCYNLHNYDI